MDKIITSRGCGKTTSLLYKANYFLKTNSQCSEIIFVCSHPSLMQEKFLKLFNNLERISFINYEEYLFNLNQYKHKKVFIDELEDLLKLLNIETFTLTI